MAVRTEDMPKLDAIFQVRVPSHFKERVDRELSSLDKKRMNEQLLEVMARHLHLANFNPLDYLRQD